MVDLLKDGQITATVVDRCLLDALGPLPTGIPLKVLAPQRPLVMATRPKATQLAHAVDDFLNQSLKGLDYALLKKRYFEENRALAEARSLDARGGGQLSPFDGLFRTHASKNGLDWRLLASQAFQESRFAPHAKSWSGAVGLFQLMPATAAELGVKRRESPEESIRAGSEYLRRLSTRVDTRLDLRQRIRFALAAFNCGLGHVEDAQRLALELHLDPTRWFGQTEKAMLMLEKPAFYRRARHGYFRATESVKYVTEIQDRYDDYVKLFP